MSIFFHYEIQKQSICSRGTSMFLNVSRRPIFFNFFYLAVTRLSFHFKLLVNDAAILPQTNVCLNAKTIYRFLLPAHAQCFFCNEMEKAGSEREPSTH